MAEPREIIADRLAKAKLELAELDALRKHLIWKVNKYTTLVNEINSGSNNQLEKDDDDPFELEKDTLYAKKSALDTILSILKDSGRALRLADIARTAIAGGFGGNHAVVSKVVPNFSSALSRSLKSTESLFVKLDRGVYDLRERHLGG